MCIPEEIKAAACLVLSKTGNFGAVQARLKECARWLSREEAAEFYVFLRANSQRWESEWRCEFSVLLQVSASDLPEEDPASQWSPVLHSLVETGDTEKVRNFIEGIGMPSWHLQPSDRECFDIYPIDGADAQGETPIAKAERLGHRRIAAYLTGIRDRILEGEKRRKK